MAPAGYQIWIEEAKPKCTAGKGSRIDYRGRITLGAEEQPNCRCWVLGVVVKPRSRYRVADSFRGRKISCCDRCMGCRDRDGSVSIIATYGTLQRLGMLLGGYNGCLVVTALQWCGSI